MGRTFAHCFKNLSSCFKNHQVLNITGACRIVLNNLTGPGKEAVWLKNALLYFHEFMNEVVLLAVRDL